MHRFTAAHRSLPFGTRIKVTNIRNGRSVLLTVNDRGPFVRGRIVDVSYRAASELNFARAGLAPVRVQSVAGC
jgi:rare lipoprotein A